VKIIFEVTMSEQKVGATAEKSTELSQADDYAIWQVLKPYIGHCLTMNHDINNPLAGVLGYCEFMLMDDDLTPTQRKHLEQISESADRIKKIVESLCDDKIAMSEKIDLRTVTEAYRVIAKKL
jgi:nitrogen-specific signal transduction histidine kinase